MSTSRGGTLLKGETVARGTGINTPSLKGGGATLSLGPVAVLGYLPYLSVSGLLCLTGKSGLAVNL